MNRPAESGADTTEGNGRHPRWLRVREYRAELGLSLRITVAALLTFALGQLVGLRQSYWAVLTAVIVLQASVGGSLKATLDRLTGTLGGAIWAVVVAVTIARLGPGWIWAALALTVAPLAILAGFLPAYRIAPVTGVIVLLGSVSQHSNALGTATQRVIDIGFGCAVALAVALLVLPARAHEMVRESAAEVLLAMGEYLALVGDVTALDPDAIDDRRSRVRAAILRVEVAAEEARRERVHRLTDAPDPGPLVRTLRRLQSDINMVGRATGEPFPEPARLELADPATRAAGDAAAFVRAVGTACKSGAAPPALDAVRESLSDFTDAMSRLREQGLTRPLPVEAAGRVFGLAFAFEQMHQDLSDLAESEVLFRP